MNPERKEKFTGLAKRLKAMTEDEKIDFVSKIGSIVNVDGKSLSLQNTCLLLFQSSDVPTMVGGFRQWQRAGRQVKKGEHGLMIWCPSSRASKDSDEEPELTFFVGTVFDIGQTEERV